MKNRVPELGDKITTIYATIKRRMGIILVGDQSSLGNLYLVRWQVVVDQVAGYHILC